MEAKNQTAAEFYSDEKHIEMWKIKRLIQKLNNTRGNGTSFVSLYMPAKENFNKITEMLTSELSAAAGIKSKQTRTSVCSAITSTKEKLKLYKSVPPNGLVLFCGVIELGDGKSEKKITIDIEPFKPINTFSYRCQNTFETAPLAAILEDDEKFGFVVVDGNGVLYATLQGNTKEVLQRMQVQLPKKHGRGGQSALRFARIREEKRHNYVRRVCELTTQHFITDDKPNVKGIIMAGSAQIKTNCFESDIFDARLKPIVLAHLDVSYGMDNGLNQAITMGAESMGSVRFVQEKKVVGKFFEQIALDTGLYVFGIQDTLKALELGALEIMLLWEDLAYTRYEFRNPHTDRTTVHVLTEAQEQQKDPKFFCDPETNMELEVVNSEGLTDWLLLNYKKFGIQIEFITDKSSDGNQFCKGFGGIGGFLRYKIDVDDYVEDDGNMNGLDDDDFI